MGGVTTPLYPVNGRLVFGAVTASSIATIWSSNGTAAGTIPLNAGTRLFVQGESPTARLGNALFFTSQDVERGTYDSELWKTDGTPAGTGLVKDIYPGKPSSGIQSLIVAEGKLYFVADDGLHGRELWMSDGTASGTRMVYDISPGLLDSNPSMLTRCGNYIFFKATNVATSQGEELWALKVSNRSAAESWIYYDRPVWGAYHFRGQAAQ